MSTRNEKRNTPAGTPRTTGTTTDSGQRNSNEKPGTQPAERDEEQTYDPVGMAGKKAGKVEEIEAQLRQEGSTGLKGGATKGKG
jgi:hypothetical protein